MDVHLSFSAPFDGIVSSKGKHWCWPNHSFIYSLSISLSKILASIVIFLFFPFFLLCVDKNELKSQFQLIVWTIHTPLVWLYRINIKRISFHCMFLCFSVLLLSRRHYVGQHSDPRCIYVPPSSGKTFYAFRIAYARCGTKPDLNGQFYENTVRMCVYVCVNIFAAHSKRLIKRFVGIYELLVAFLSSSISKLGSFLL